MQTKIGFAVIYRWRLLAGKEEGFREAWEVMTRLLRESYGALGSRLHSAEDGTWVAYAQWPDRDTWERSEVTEPEGLAAMTRMKEGVEVRFPPVLLDPIADFLVYQD